MTESAADGTRQPIVDAPAKLRRRAQKFMAAYLLSGLAGLSILLGFGHQVGMLMFYQPHHWWCGCIFEAFGGAILLTAALAILLLTGAALCAGIGNLWDYCLERANSRGK